MEVAQLEEKPEIVRLNKLKDKLLDLSPRSRKIRFSISKWLSWDLTELVNKNNQNLISNFFFSASNLIISHRENKENFSLNLEALLKQSSSEDLLRFQKKIECLQKKNLSIYQEKGYKSLFLGIIFLRGYFYNSKNVLRLINAPLFLLPCDLERVKNLSLVFNSERKLNHSLLYYLQKELALPKDKFTDFLNALEKNNEEIDKWENYLFFLNNQLQQLISTSHIKIKLSPTLSSFLEEKELLDIKINTEPIPDPFAEENSTIIKNNSEKNFYAESFVKLTLLNKPNNYPENQLEIVLNFCLTIDSEPNLSLFHDFEEIIDEYSQDKIINWSKSALNLLRGEMDNIIAYPEKKETNHQSNPLYTPFPSDPSQNRILRVIFQDFSENALCIDGPPGTGKSQLICNIITNSLFYQKKVLVICEKEVALKVIYDKLSSLGLNRSIVKINELAQTPQIYREILNNIGNNQKEITNQNISDITKKIVNLEEKLSENFKKIEKYCEIEKEFQTNYQTSLQEVYIRFERKTQLTPTIIKLNNWVRNKEQLDKLKAQTKNYISKFTKIFSKWKQICLKLKNLFLENNSREFEFNLENQNNFQEVISNILKELKGEKKTKFNLISKILRINLLQKYSDSHHSPEIIKTKLNELEGLQANEHYQKFFSFLKIENFGDFWQKCSSEEFLFDIQEFISEEFLTIGELSTVSNGEAKKNIDHFLKRVLVDHEFSYLDNYEKITEQAVYFNWIKEVEEENKENLTSWNYEDLAKVQEEQREIVEKKISLVKNILKIKQKQNLEKLLTNRELSKELSKKRKISSLKKTFPELVSYFPIWLSTPEVIASITSLQEPTFDFLVFDEASQIPLEKSIPLLARAKKCIIIGDEQQLPPTDFFKSHLENDEDIWKEEEQLLSETEEKINLETDDLEKNSSLLTYAKKYARNREKLTLLYHYRSKYPELIEFSNQAFYNGILQIVSASEIKKKDYLPIEYHYQNKGRWINNENQIEARYIIDLLKTLPENKEVGIITFNSTQRDFLTDLVGEGDKNNNLFIKSLEEVQGDERDIIIFSIGYAPNKEGKILLNFGPLNKEGGEKRLNVAISRAREKVIIVTSLLPNDLKRITEEDENRKPGPKLFKKYLEYAYHCSQKQQEKVQFILEHSLPKITNSSLHKKSVEIKEFGSLFEKKVYNELVKQKYSYEIHKQVKSIGYRIDLAIWDNQIQQYILGIECDGEYWHGKLENIERDVYRQQILEDKGWKIMRILSRDWSRNKEKEVERINQELTKLASL